MKPILHVHYDWLPKWERWAHLAHLGFPVLVVQEKVFFLVNKQLTKLVWSRWLDIGLFLFCIFIDLGLVSGNKNAKKNLVNIQPPLYLPHAWSITHKIFLNQADFARDRKCFS